MEYLSTTNLAKEMDLPGKELFEKLQGLGLITRNGDKWVLTDLGRSKGGQTRISPKFGEFIVWPEDISFEGPSTRGKQLNATAIGKHFNMSSQRLNLILAELGWQEKNAAGWSVTKLGTAQGGRQMEHDSGSNFVIWPSAILDDRRLLDVVAPKEIAAPSAVAAPVPHYNGDTSSTDYRIKYPANQRTQDGHYVRSRAEMLIDDWLYQYRIVHAYERRLPIEAEVLCDFYIPSGEGRSKGIYIEFWGLEGEPGYENRKRVKLEHYRKNEFSLIEITSSDIDNLDDVLQRKLLKFNIKVG